MGMIFLHNLSIDKVIFVSKTLQNGFSFLMSNSNFFTSKGPVILSLVYIEIKLIDNTHRAILSLSL